MSAARGERGFALSTPHAVESIVLDTFLSIDIFANNPALVIAALQKVAHKITDKSG
jgi:hypothetical protein